MQPIGWTRDFLLLGVWMLVGASIGGLFGYAGAGFACGALAHLLMNYLRLRRLHHWLLHDSPMDYPPVHGGLLGDVGDRVKRLQRRLERQLEETSATLRHLRESYAALKDGVVILSADNTIEWCNASALDLLRLRYPEDVGQPLVNLMRNPDFAGYLARGEYEHSFELAAPGHSERWLNVQATAFGEASKVLFVRDVTALKQLETMRQDFLANISHEMRTPLTVISGYLDSLGQLLPQQSATVDKALLQMRQQAGRMESLLRDLMLLSQLESSEHANRAEVEKIAVTALLQSIRDSALAACASQRIIELHCPEQLLFHGDRLSLESVFSNLVFNAVRYTASGGHVRISFAVEGACAVFAVNDDGVGIDPIHIPRLTERFYRVDKSRSIDGGGTGLGLAIVKHALKRLDGQLEIVSRPGAGSTFICRFPASHVSACPVSN